MKFCVLAPKEAYLDQAGVRIRYQRVAPHLEAAGHSLEIRVIDDIKAVGDLDHDAFLFSKVYDARSFLVAQHLHRDGRLVGVDLFDDYFSQGADSRFVRHREWLRTMAGWSDYVLCSTPRMKSVAAGFMPGTPVHILNDPFEQVDLERMASAAERTLERTLRHRVLDVAWFGNGDNPHFSVGLKDVHAFGPVLRDLERTGLKVRLKLLTNRRALAVQGLEALGRLPVPWTIDEWSLAGEEALLRESLVAFIPVNAQAFSVAKSLNRAVSALSSGTQVLSVGYPLYEPLHGFVYRDAASFLADVEARTPRVRRETLPALMDRFADWADPRSESERLIAFFAALARQKAYAAKSLSAQDPRIVGVVHGVRSGADVHQLAQRHKHFSISSPFSSDSPNYDLRITGGMNGEPVSIDLEERTLQGLRQELHERLAPAVSRTGRQVRRLELGTLYPGPAAVIARAMSHRSSRLANLSAYDSALGAEFDVLRSIFPGLELLLSEAEPPYGVGLGRGARSPASTAGAEA
jgi:hypothetical protein